MILYSLLTYIVIVVLLVIIYKTCQLVPKYIWTLKLPGPKRHGIFGNALVLFAGRAQYYKNLRQFAKTYYPAYSLLAFPYCSVNIVNELDAEVILSSMKHSRKGTLYRFIRKWLQNGLLTSSGTKWQKRRKLLTPAFHFNLLQDFLKIFRNETNRLVHDIDVQSDKNNEIDVTPLITDFTLFSINETSMGTKLDLDLKEDNEYHNAILELMEILTYRLCAIWLYSNLLFYYFSSSGYKENRLVKVLHKFTRNVIKNKIKAEENENAKSNSYSTQKRLAMLDLLIEARKENLIDLNGICEEVDTFMFEGHDTTSMCLCFTLLILANHRKEQDLIFEEIAEIIGDDEVTYQNLNEMKYLEMCIKESLRLFPSVPFIARLADEDFYLPSNGHLVKKDTDLHVHILDIHRNPETYEDPDKFDPSRFLPENIAKRHPFAFIPFSAGPRNCIGQKFAMLEVKTAIIGILQKFILEPVDTLESVTNDIVIDLVLRPVNGIKVKFVKRENKI